MPVSYQPGMTAEWKLSIWPLWRQGQTLSQIGRSIGKHPASVFEVLKTNGGYSPRIQSRSGRHLTLAQREDIFRGLAEGKSYRTIATAINSSASTVCREINRNGGAKRYRPSAADCNAWRRAKRPKIMKLEENRALKNKVESLAKKKWSPEQIAGWLQENYPGNKKMHVSHETIYRSLFLQARGGLRKELKAHLRSARVMRQSRSNNFRGSARGGIIDGVSISKRPPEVMDRAIPGHWEGDLISGSKNSHVATLVERQSRYTLIVKLKGKDTKSVVSALKKRVNKLPTELKKSLTWDRGMELADHKTFTISTKMDVFFCDPHSPWQRGTNENTNRLIRQYLPKKTDLSQHKQSDLNKIARELNERPRKTLGYKTPAEFLYKVLH